MTERMRLPWLLSIHSTGVHLKWRVIAQQLSLGRLVMPSPQKGGLGKEDLPETRKVADTHEFTLTPARSPVGQGELT